MRTKLSFAALAALALASCSSDELIEQNSGAAINFSVVANKATRAGLEGTTQANLKNIKLWGISADNKVFMGGEDGLSLNYVDNAWTYGSDLYFWPNQSINFYGVAPATAPTGVTYSVSGAGQTINFTATADGKSDIVYSTNAGETKEAHKTGNAVVMNMRHALSQISIRLGNTNGNLKITVKEIKLTGVANAGTFTLASATTDATKLNQVKDATAWGSWTSTAGATGDYVIYNADATPYEMHGKKTADEFDNNKIFANNLFLMPQTLKPWTISKNNDALTGVDGARILVKCKVEQKTGVAGQYAQVWPKTVSANQADNYAYIAIPLENPTNDPQKLGLTEDADKAKFDCWLQGKKYTYTLNFGQGAGYDPTDPTKPELVLVGIKFDVKVDTFQDGGSSDNNMTFKNN